MADVLIVCVREDEPQAKALADMFEAAGFTIGGAPGSDAALRSSGAGVVVWSQASIRSRPFLDAAQRVINANKAVVASLIEPPPASSIGDALAFDLSRWTGDPDDPSLDPLFFAVDRMVNAARQAVGAPAAEPAPQAFEPPPSLRPTPPPRPARPAPPPAPQHHQPDLGSEAEHWRAIRNSRDPAVFLDYLSRYGADGAFVDVAELRLKQLTESGADPRQPPPPRMAAPMPHLEPPRRAPEPPRRPDPPPRRIEATPPPPQQRRRDPPPPSYEPRLERIESREPPRPEGGALRAFVLIALLGGAALAGGLYFGGNMGDSGRAPDSAEVIAPPAPQMGGDPETAEVEASTPFSEVARPQPAARRDPLPTERARAQPPQREPAAARQPEPEPARTTTVANAAPSGTGGPVSLNPGASTGPISGPGVAVPLSPPQTAPTTPAPIPAAATPTRPPPQGAVSWAQRPSARRISDAYPSRALRDGVGGRVELDCTVLASMALTCSIASETPAGLGFGRAALSAAGSYRARPALSDGASAVGARSRIVVQFQAPAQ
jgi:protein TonB